MRIIIALCLVYTAVIFISCQLGYIPYTSLNNKIEVKTDTVYIKPELPRDVDIYSCGDDLNLYLFKCNGSIVRMIAEYCYSNNMGISSTINYSNKRITSYFCNPLKTFDGNNYINK